MVALALPLAREGLARPAPPREWRELIFAKMRFERIAVFQHGDDAVDGRGLVINAAWPPSTRMLRAPSRVALCGATNRSLRARSRRFRHLRASAPHGVRAKISETRRHLQQRPAQRAEQRQPGEPPRRALKRRADRDQTPHVLAEAQLFSRPRARSAAHRMRQRRDAAKAEPLGELVHLFDDQFAAAFDVRPRWNSPRSVRSKKTGYTGRASAAVREGAARRACRASRAATKSARGNRRRACRVSRASMTLPCQFAPRVNALPRRSRKSPAPACITRPSARLRRT